MISEAKQKVKLKFDCVIMLINSIERRLRRCRLDRAESAGTVAMLQCEDRGKIEADSTSALRKEIHRVKN